MEGRQGRLTSRSHWSGDFPAAPPSQDDQELGDLGFSKAAFLSIVCLGLSTFAAKQTYFASKNILLLCVFVFDLRARGFDVITSSIDLHT